MKKRFTTILMFIVLIIGISLMLYPSLSDYWNSFHQSYVISNYADSVENVSDEKYQKIWEEALEYNRAMKNRSVEYVMSEEQIEEYEKYLSIDSTGVMGYIEIPGISCYLPIYHGTDENVLQVAVGHLDWTSLPVGGLGSHCVLSGHRGLPSAKLFSNLDQLNTGDIFILRILDEILTYEVDAIHIVEPNDTKYLQIEEGEDYCTLVTCTPYGINTHRLLVRGHRIENQKDSSHIRITADAMQVDPIIVAPVIGIPVLIILLILVSTNDRKENKLEKDEENAKR